MVLRLLQVSQKLTDRILLRTRDLARNRIRFARRNGAIEIDRGRRRERVLLVRGLPGQP